MLIIYRISDGAICSNSGTCTCFPEGPPFEAEVQNAIKDFGGVPEDYGEYRLHDENDAALVQQIMAAGSYTLAFDQDGNPSGVDTIYSRVQLTCPATAEDDQAITIQASAEGGEGIEAILYIDGVEQARANMPASWGVVFESAGEYEVRVDAGRHGQAGGRVIAS